MSSDGTGLGESPQVVVRCQEDRNVVVRFTNLFVIDQDTTAFDVIVEADGLQARIDGGEVHVWDQDLVRFLEKLAADFRGWQGERLWQTSHLSLSATFHSRGHVCLTWTLRPSLIRDTWEVSVTTWQEAGEQMAALAADTGHFLRQATA